MHVQSLAYDVVCEHVLWQLNSQSEKNTLQVPTSEKFRFCKFINYAHIIVLTNSIKLIRD